MLWYVLSHLHKKKTFKYNLYEFNSQTRPDDDGAGTLIRFHRIIDCISTDIVDLSLYLSHFVDCYNDLCSVYMSWMV